MHVEVKGEPQEVFTFKKTKPKNPGSLAQNLPSRLGWPAKPPRDPPISTTKCWDSERMLQSSDHFSFTWGLGIKLRSSHCRSKRLIG